MKYVEIPGYTRQCTYCLQYCSSAACIAYGIVSGFHFSKVLPISWTPIPSQRRMYTLTTVEMYPPPTSKSCLHLCTDYADSISLYTAYAGTWAGGSGLAGSGVTENGTVCVGTVGEVGVQLQQLPLNWSIDVFNVVLSWLCFFTYFVCLTVGGCPWKERKLWMISFSFWMNTDCYTEYIIFTTPFLHYPSHSSPLGENSCRGCTREPSHYMSFPDIRFAL